MRVFVSLTKMLGGRPFRISNEMFSVCCYSGAAMFGSRMYLAGTRVIWQYLENNKNSYTRWCGRNQYGALEKCHRLPVCSCLRLGGSLLLFHVCWIRIYIYIYIYISNHNTPRDGNCGHDAKRSFGCCISCFVRCASNVLRDMS
jgi:hypothetical protein